MRLADAMMQSLLGLGVLALAWWLREHQRRRVAGVASMAATTPAELEAGERREAERSWLTHQAQRRQIINRLLAFSGFVILVAAWLPRGLLMLSVWSLLALLVFWILGLGIIDAARTRAFFRAELTRQREERRRWHDQVLRQSQRRRSTGG